MKPRNAFLLLPVIIALSLLAAFVITAPVFAQDELPPEEPVPTEIIPVVEENPIVEPAPPEVAPLEETVPVEEAPVEEELPPVVEGAISEGVPAAIEEVLAPALEEAANAGVTFVDEIGIPVSPTTEDGAQTLTSGDPWYKVGTTTYYFMKPGGCGALPNCQESATPIQLAVTNIATTGLPSDGKIYVAADSYSDSIFIDANANPIYAGFKGFIGAVVDGAPAVILTSGRIRMEGCTTGFTVTGFEINVSSSLAGIYVDDCVGVIKIEDVDINNTNSSGHGIEITNHNGTVTINRAKVNGNAGGGALIDNTAGTGGVTITNSSFDYNASDMVDYIGGLTISTKGAIVIDGVTASHTTGGQGGVFIQRSGALTIKNSVFNNNSGFGVTNDWSVSGITPTAAISLTNVYASSNQAGMDLYTKGDITLTGVHSDLNTSGQGASLNTCIQSAGVCTWLGTGKVTIKDSSFDGNGSSGYGLYVNSRGAITLTNVSASDNDDSANTDGARLHAHYSQLASAVTITNGIFNNNGDQGLQVFTKGTINLTKVKANSNNDGYGVELKNTYDTAASAVIVTGSALSDNQFNYNDSTGLQITSNGAVTVKYADGSGNGGSGLGIDNIAGSGAVSVSKGTFGWWMEGNSDAGVMITTKGNVTVSDVTATGYGNDGLHVFIDSTVNSTATITNSDFWYSGLNGLDIEGRGTITLSNVSAGENANLGAELAAFKVGNIIIKDSSFDYNGDHPYDYGLHAYSAQGTITLTNVSASWNTGTGAYIANLNATTAKAVSITGGNFNNNTRTGLQVYSKGAITLKNVNAYANNETNIDAVQDQRTVREVIDANETDAMTFQSISGTVNNLTVTAVAFTPEMWMTGCTANTTHYWDSNYDGIVEHDYGAVAGVCTLHIKDHFAGTEDASGGAYKVWMGGTYDATKDAFGAYLDNTAGTAGITITNNAIPASNGPLGYLRDFSLNTAGGLILHTKGAVSLSNLVLDDNGGYGVLVHNEDAEATHATNVTMSGIYANENYWSGIWIVNKGSITMTNVASWNHTIAGTGYGAYLDNDAGKSNVNIKNTIAMPFGFDYNHERGLNIFTNGSVSVTNVQMVGNDEDGIRIWSGTSTGVTLTNCVMNNNNGYGASISSKGPIVVTGGSFDYNAIVAHFDNTYAPLESPKTVTLSNFSAYDNPGGGLRIDSYGAVSLSSVAVDYSDNIGIIGIYIDNQLGTAGVALTKVNSNYSGGVGVFIATNGALTYKGGEVKHNGSDGISLYNDMDSIPKAVILSDLYIYNNDGYGAYMVNKGSFTLTNVRSNSNNSGYGLWLDNKACTTATPCPVSILQSGSGVNEFNLNDGGGGLMIDTYGVVVMNKVTASTNEGYGARVHNNSADPLKPANVTVTGGTFNSNDGTGLYVLSRGIISVNGVEASGNLDGYYGAYLNNLADTSGAKGVNVLKSKFNENTLTGLIVHTYGAVVLNTVEASENDAAGADINNDHGLGKPVTVLATYGANKFLHNFNDNIVIVSNGSVALTNVTGNSSIASDGIEINNASSTSTITLTNVTANSNYNDGFTIRTKANVTIREITAMFNSISGIGYCGVYINTNETSTAKVTITNGLVMGNVDFGIALNLAPNKLFTLSNVFYFGNNSDNSGNGPNLLVY